jgi:diamine N-acetyltransferase
MDGRPVVELREITMDNFHECIGLQVADEQRYFVAPNVYSLAEAKADGVSVPLAMYAAGQMVGFIMYWYDAENGKGYIERLMVAAEHQGRGYGKSALQQVVERLRETPGCHRIQTSFAPANRVADGLYYQLGFRRTGEMVHGETVVVLELCKGPGQPRG